MKTDKTVTYLVGIVLVIAIIVSVVSLYSANYDDDLTGAATASTCSDTDSGIDYKTKGTISGGTWKTTGKTYAYKIDSCNVKGQLQEGFCPDSKHGFYVFKYCNQVVGTGYICYDGACALDSDSDGVPDTLDTCAGYDDKEDTDGDGIPDGCEKEVPLLGVYATSIKVSSVSSDENVTATIDAVEGISGNLYGYSAWDGDTSDPTKGFYWPNFLEFLDETEGTDTNIIAVVSEKHNLGSSQSLRWGATGCNDCAEWDVDEWTDSLVDAAKEFSALSATYPNLIGFTVDDFGGYPCSATHEIRDADCYAVDDVAAITAAAKTSNPDFKFLPTIYYPQLGESIVPGYIFGSPYGVQMINGEYAAMTLTFSLDTVPSEADLSFLHYDTYLADYELPVYKEVLVNGVSLYDDSVNGDDYVEYFTNDIVPYLQKGENEIVLRLSSGGANFYQDKMWYIWNLALIVDGKSVSWDIAYDVYASAEEYVNDKGDTVNNSGRIVAKSNAEYIIDIDGVLAPYEVDQDHYSLENYTVLLEATEEALGDKPQIVVHYPAFWGKDFDASILREQVETAASLTHGVLLFAHQLYLYFPQEGVFVQRESDDTSYALLSYFPGYQLGVEGWYQTWTSKEKLSGTVTVTVKDNWDGTYTPDYFVKKISVLETGDLYYNDSVNDNEGVETLSLNLGIDPVTLVLSVVETDGVGNAPTKVYFDVVGADGNTLDTDAWNFESGTTYDNLKEVYTELADAYQDISGTPKFAAPEVEQGFFERIGEFLKRFF